MRVAILTGGGDCPGLNPAIRAATLRLIDYGHQVIGFRRGWWGAIEKVWVSLNEKDVDEIIHIGGTILGSSRTNPFKKDEDGKDNSQRAIDNFRSLDVDAVIAIGGEDTLGVANKFHQLGFPMVGVPKTMDNDLNGTDFTFGFDSAVAVAVDAIDRLRDTARSHNRVMVLEVMGRHAGWVALYVGLGGGADWIAIPEVPFNLNALHEHLQILEKRGKQYALVVASEGVQLPKDTVNPEAAEAEGAAEPDQFGHAILKNRAVAETIAEMIEERTKRETRPVVIGHIQRGGSPTVFDRVLASRLGLKAAELVHCQQFGQMASLDGLDITSVPLQEATKELKKVPRELYDEASLLFRR